MANRLLRAVTVSLIAGPIAGVLAAAFFYFIRFLAGPENPEFVSPPLRPTELSPSSDGGYETGPEVMHRAQNLVLETLRTAPPEGLSNAEVGELTGLNPPIKERRGEVTRTVLAYLAEQGLVEKEGQRYRLAQ